jgi:hypothetical protein
MDPLLETLFGEEKKRAKIPVSLIIVCITAGSAIYFYARGDYGTATAMAVMGVALRSGYRVGAATYLGFLIGGALSMVMAAPLGKLLEPLFQQMFATHGVINRVLSIGVVGSITILIVTVSMRNLVRRQFRDRLWLKSCDKWLGLVCGGIQGMAIFLVMASGAIIIEPIAREELMKRNGGGTQRLAQRVVGIAEATRSGAVGPWVTAWNPFERFGSLKSLLQGISVLQNPESMNSVVHHPALEEFFEQPEFQRIREQLRAEPRLNSVLSSDAQMTFQTVASLLDSPAILRMLDNPDFRRTLKQVVGEVDSQMLLSANDDW